MRKIISGFAADESGATMIEYALLMTFIALAALGAAAQLGKSLGNSFNNTANAFGNA